MKKKLLSWGKTPIIVPRWMLTIKYLAFIVLGVLTLIGGIPSLSLVTFEGYTRFWAIAVMLTAFAAALGTFQEQFESFEKWAAVFLTGFLITWSVAAIWRAIAEGDLDRMAGSWAVLMLSLMPGARALGLLRTSGRTHG